MMLIARAVRISGPFGFRRCGKTSRGTSRACSNRGSNRLCWAALPTTSTLRCSATIPRLARWRSAPGHSGFWVRRKPTACARGFAVYLAQRFAGNKRVAIVDRDGASGAAILARSAREVRADLLDDDVQRRLDGGSGWTYSAAYRAIVSMSRSAIERRRGTHRYDRAGRSSSAVRTPDHLHRADTTRLYGVVRSGRRRHRTRTGRVRTERSGAPRRRCADAGRGRIVGTHRRVVRSDYLGNDDPTPTRRRHWQAACASRDSSRRSAGKSLESRRTRLLHVFGQRALVELDGVLQRRPARIPLVATPYADDARREAAWGALIVASDLLQRTGRSAAEHVFRSNPRAATRIRRCEAR